MFYLSRPIYGWVKVLLFDFFCQEFFLVFSGAEYQPHSQRNLGEFFSNFEKKKSQSSKKIFFEDWDFHSVNTHKLQGGVLLQFNGKVLKDCNQIKGF